LSKKITIYAPVLSIATCIFWLSFCNTTFWSYAAKTASIPLLISMAIVLASVIYACLTIISFRYVYKPLLMAALLIAAVSSYAMDHFGFIISSQTFQAIIESDRAEMLDLFNWRFITSLVLLFLLPAVIIVCAKVTHASFKTKLLHLLFCILLVIGNAVLLNKHYVFFIRNAREIRYYINPVRPIYSLTKYISQSLSFSEEPSFVELDPNPIKVTSNAKPKLVILVVGEADRSMNHSLNGYHKNTNPLLAQRGDVYSFNKFYSCGTETLVSLPCMFSAFTREEYNQHKARYTENILDLLQKAQVRVLWRDNDGGCKHVCDRVSNDDFTSHGQQDDVLLKDLQQHININNGDQLIVLHKLGNHGPAYYKHYPNKFKQFTPTCDTTELTTCTMQQIANTYDNIILYTDDFLDRIIKQLESNTAYQTALIYVSDHGESLGENGIYLHAMPYWLAPKEQIHVPFFFWASQDFALNREHLTAIKDQEFSHDHLFHSLMGLFGVRSRVYKQELDIFFG